MSHIPNNAMPHAGPAPAPATKIERNQSRRLHLSRRASQVGGMARANPKTVAAAGAVLLAGVAAVAVPLLRRRSSPVCKGGQAKRKGG